VSVANRLGNGNLLVTGLPEAGPGRHGQIDRSFVNGLGHNAQDSAIVRSVVALARTLELSVTAEGIETPAQQAQLRLLGCEFGQGYLFGRPQPWQAAEALLLEHYPLESRSAA
jgi:EAL domain-containing protein (putative c-di-GMP-specific phosphodiesterase class I)